ncbi:hypothetical protein CYMTET_8085 [Cymbomonas tetramitiformis]|uniref:Uncharacterized protein n=1 Tax=Cymbomonas tetramitiformis TaxID=36881 RepID=A0AAE0GTY3_9CHLO|nr:hypothetical protein CYMTET_8085 [Cymbomonas tetramitiformis]
MDRHSKIKMRRPGIISSESGMNPTIRREICRDFSRGRCPRVHCKFFHSSSHYHQSSGHSTPRSRKRLKGVSPGMTHNGRVRNCRAFSATGKCSWGENCKFNHAVSPLGLPDELLLEVVSSLRAQEICSLMAVCTHFRKLCLNTTRWFQLYVERWGFPSRLSVQAVLNAGSWHRLYKCKHITEREHMPWTKPCYYELEALTDIMMDNEGLSLEIQEGGGVVSTSALTKLSTFHELPSPEMLPVSMLVTMPSALPLSNAVIAAAVAPTRHNFRVVPAAPLQYSAHTANNPAVAANNPAVAANNPAVAANNPAVAAPHQMRRSPGDMPWASPTPHPASAAATPTAPPLMEYGHPGAMSHPDSFKAAARNQQPAGSLSNRIRPPVAVTFLMDGSGSLSETDFLVMRNYVKMVGVNIIARHAMATISVVQFTTEVQVEIPMMTHSPGDFLTYCDSFARMSGGTNLISPIFKVTVLPPAAGRHICVDRLLCFLCKINHL